MDELDVTLKVLKDGIVLCQDGDEVVIEDKNLDHLFERINIAICNRDRQAQQKV